MDKQQEKAQQEKANYTELSGNEQLRLIHNLIDQWIEDLDAEIIEAIGYIDAIRQAWPSQEDFEKRSGKYYEDHIKLETDRLTLQALKLEIPEPMREDERKRNLGFFLDSLKDGVVREFNEDLAELMKESMLKAKNKLSQHHVFIDATVDRPILNSDTMEIDND